MSILAAVQAYSIGNEWIRAVAVLDMIGEAGLQPDVVSYNTAIQAVRDHFCNYDTMYTSSMCRL
jgi:hypothetical protein